MEHSLAPWTHEESRYFSPRYRIFDAVRNEIAAFAKEEDAQLAAAAPDLLRELQGLLDDIVGLIEESDGVYGLHLNGDVSPWSELVQGGRFERLLHIKSSLEVIAKATGK